MNLLALPAELLVTILTFLDVRDVLSFCRVCRLAYITFMDSAILQYLVALYSAGMVDASAHSPLGARDRLSYVHHRETLWKNLNLRAYRRIPLPVDHRHSHIHDLTGGIYIFGELSTVPDSIRTNSLRYAHLPTCMHGLGSSHLLGFQQLSWWRHIPLGVDALTMRVSLEQNDLLAVLTSAPSQNVEETHIFQLHLKKFSTGKYHPLAQQPVIQFHEHRIERNQCIASIDIAGPYLLVLLTWLRAPNVPDEVFVYDWMTAFLILHVSSGSFTYRGAAFLSLDTFILTNMRENVIEFLRLRKNAEGDNPIDCRWIGKLALPTLRRGSSLISMNCRTDAIRSCAPGQTKTLESSGTSERNITPVYCAPDKNIVQFRMYLQGGGEAPNVGYVSLFAFVAHRGNLLKIVESIGNESESTSPTEAPVKPWNEWGPSSTRWSGSDETDTAWMAGVAGQRQIYITGDTPRRIHVRDYNAATVRKELLTASNESHQNRIEIISEETVTAHQECFADDIRSSLPFVEIVSKKGYEYDGVLMDENHVIGLTEDEEDGSIRQLDVFIMAPDIPETCNCADAMV